MSYLVDLRIFDEHEVNDNDNAQAKYLVHGINDLLWTDSLDDVLEFIRQDIIEHNEG